MTVLPTFTTGQVLTSSDANSMANSGLVFVKSQTVGTGVTGVTVSSAFSADYDSYRVVIDGGLGSTVNAGLSLTFGATATGYAYGYGYFSNGVAGGVGDGAAAYITVGQINTNFSSTAFDVFSPFLARYTAVFGGNSYDLNNGNSRGPYNGVLKNTTSYTAFTLTPGSGTITGGTITVYGYRKGN